MPSTKPIQPRGPASSPSYPPSTDPSNPYNFTPTLLHAGSLPPKLTSTHIYFFGYEGTDPHVSFQQWFPAPFTAPRNPYPTTDSAKHDDTPVEFPTSEHYMMYHKALLMGDQEIADKILADHHPSTAKKYGRMVRGFKPEIWDRECDGVVERGNWEKFSQNEDLREVLLQTGERVIVEASPDDKIWGIGFNSEDAEGHEAEWGENKLGKALMRVRDRLRREQTQ